eukprot:10657410-Lingulodinium_polyedra.AAC.1
MERFHSTPWALFREMAQAVLDRVPREQALAAWTQRRLERAAACDTAQPDADDEAADAADGASPSPAVQ